VLPYSSGTSGRPKGVLLTHRNLVANLRQLHAITLSGRATRCVAVLPFFHIYGMTCLLTRGSTGGSRRHPAPVRPGRVPRVIAAVPVQRVLAVPPILVALAKHPMVESYDLSSVETVCSGAAPLDAGPGPHVGRRLGCRVVQGYGMTEMSPVSHFVPDGVDPDVATVGPLLPNMEAMVVDPATGAELPPGERGELWCRGPNVMAGYLNAPEATAATLDADGWLHTGDLVTVDADGVFTVVDRLKELIKYKGWSVAPAELEAVLLAHDRIADAAVIGVRDAEGEEVPKGLRRPAARRRPHRRGGDGVRRGDGWRRTRRCGRWSSSTRSPGRRRGRSFAGSSAPGRRRHPRARTGRNRALTSHRRNLVRGA
jgi:acyl-CoA synthetase (AMP-forming)/AMP-acid ligase II